MSVTTQHRINIASSETHESCNFPDDVALLDRRCTTIKFWLKSEHPPPHPTPDMALLNISCHFGDDTADEENFMMDTTSNIKESDELIWGKGKHGVTRSAVHKRCELTGTLYRASFCGHKQCSWDEVMRRSWKLRLAPTLCSFTCIWRPSCVLFSHWFFRTLDTKQHNKTVQPKADACPASDFYHLTVV